MIPRSLVVATLAAAACSAPHQITLSIDTAAGVPCDIDRIRVVATATGTATEDHRLSGAQLPVSVTLLDDTPSGNFQLTISAFKGDVEVMRTSGPLRFSDHGATEAVWLDPRCTPDAPCMLADSMAAGASPPVDARFACRYGATPGLETFVDACNAPGFTSVLTSGSPVPVRLTALEPELLASQFQFYGRPIRQIWVARDGYLSFAPDNPDPTGVLTPGALDRDINHLGQPPPQQSVMAFWDTLTLRANGVCYSLQGDAPNQQLRVTWEHVCLTSVCGADDLNFTITVDEGSQRVVIAYGTMSAASSDGAHGGNATVGLVNDATGCPADECALDTGLCKDKVTPCGYSQVFSKAVQSPGVPNTQFVPIGKSR